MKKNKATSKSSPESNQLNNTSITAQQSRMLAALNNAGSKGVTTVQGRDDHNVMHVAGRVRELRDQGYVIATIWTTGEDSFGRKHRMARYVLLKRQGAAA